MAAWFSTSRRSRSPMPLAWASGRSAGSRGWNADMSPLVKIRAERDQMSAVERRIADFILDNAQLLRDYSSQQLADALGISQSSVVKFTQKLGFKGYPDLKYSVGEAIARADNGDATQVAAQAPADVSESVASSLWRCKS